MGRIANTVTCGACAKPLVLNTKADGGVTFPFTLVHAVAPRSKRDTCNSYPDSAPTAPASTPRVREERWRIRRDARIEARNSRHAAEEKRRPIRA
jgi:hypothetical protein